MNRIDRYTIGLFWGYFFGGLLVFVTLYMAIGAMSTLVDYKDVSLNALLRYNAYQAPEIVQKMLPVGCLLGLILMLSSMNKSNELVALFSSGMSLFRICTPALLSVLFLAGVGFVISDRILPPVTKQKNYIFYNEISKKPGMFSTVKTNRIWYRSKSAIFNIKTLSTNGDRAQGLTLYFFNDAWDLLQMITAHDVDLQGTNWTLHDGSVTIFTQDSSFPLTSQFKSKNIVMSEDAKDLQSSGQTSDMLSQGELKRFIDRNKEAGLDTLRYEVDYHSKYGFALSGLVMCLLGIPFSVGRARSGGTVLNVGICIGLVFGYYILYSSALTLGQHGTLPPVVAAWAPNVLMSGFAIWLLLRLRR